MWPSGISVHCRMACPRFESPSWHVSRRSDGGFYSQFLSFQAEHPPPGGRGGLDVTDQGNRDPKSTRQVVPPLLCPKPKAQHLHERPYLLKPHAPTITPRVHSNGRPHGRSGKPTSPLPCTSPMPLALHAARWPCGPAVSEYTAAWRVLGSNPPPGMSVGALTVLSPPGHPPSTSAGDPTVLSPTSLPPSTSAGNPTVLSFPHHPPCASAGDPASLFLLLSFRAEHPPVGGRGGLDVADQGNRGPEGTRQVAPPPPLPPPQSPALAREALPPETPRSHHFLPSTAYWSAPRPPWQTSFAPLLHQPYTPGPPCRSLAMWPSGISVHCRMACPGFESPS